MNHSKLSNPAIPPHEFGLVLPVVVWVQFGKDFPDVRQNERESLLEWETVRPVGQLQGELTLTGVLIPLLYPGYKVWDRGLMGHLLIG